MCGIGGFLGDFNPNCLERMNTAMLHRGPDGAGIWHDAKAGIGLAHRRLSILDLSEAAAQPMQSVGDRYVVSYNGEIYNFKDIYNNLKSKYELNPKSDTSVLAPYFDAEGVASFAKLNGMFAFALWDKETQTLTLARDQMGVKPLYYAETSQGFVFASELKTLLEAVPDDFDLGLDMDAMQDYLTYIWSPGTRTMLRQVKKLEPGHYLQARRGAEGAIETHIERFYTPPLMRDTQPQTPAALRNLLGQVVQEQCIADVPVGAFLSGGVDSSAVVAHMVQADIRPKQTYCVTFHGSSMAGEGFSEDITYARQVAQHLRVSLTEVTSDASLLDNLPQLVEILEEPLADPAPLYVQQIAAAARADGIKVLMSGTGGDDVFAGYRRHQAARLRQRLGMLSQPVGFACAQLGALGPQSVQRRLKKLGYMLSGDENTFLHRSFEFSPLDTVNGVIHRDVIDTSSEKRQNGLKMALRASEGFSPLKRLLYMEYHGFLPDHNLTYTDKAAMQEGVEVRVPLIDPRLVAFGAALPEHQLIYKNETKWLLKKSLEALLPQNVLYRSKAGFGAPIRQWLLHDKRDLMHDVLFSQRAKSRGVMDIAGVERLIKSAQLGQTDGAYTLLSLMMVELWCQRFVDG